jgi:alpha-beta hydrolase superfamily lysophospholipase
MIGVDKIGEIRRAYFEQHRSIKEIVRTLSVSRNKGGTARRPGRALHREGLVFRPDWEKVVMPVVDFALKQPGVDPKRIALMGVSMGGYLAPRATAFEKRIAALIANDGIYDFMAPFRTAVPPEKWDMFVTALKAEQAPRIDAMLDGQMKASPTVRWSYSHGM